MRVLLIALSLMAYASADVQVESVTGYHERVGIPTASNIKAAENAYFANQNSNARIIGGNTAQPNSHPYLGGLLITFKNHASMGVCGSSLISRDRLVTAAHCWFDGRLQASRFVVVLGSHFLFSGGERIATSTIATHPAWNPATMRNNIAVIYLQNPVLLTSNVRPIALPSDLEERFNGVWAVAVGYGVTTDQPNSVSMMAVVSEVNLQVITIQQCQSVYGALVQPDNICTNGLGGVGICGGDSGGPLFVNRNGTQVLIGISSFAAAAGCERGLPSGFTRITSFYDFLKLHL